MALQTKILENGFLQLILNPPKSPQEYAFRFSTFYEQFALTATPTPVTAGKRVALEKALLGAFSDPRSGTGAKGMAGIKSGLGGFWLGTPIPGGVIVAFLGGPVLGGCLTSKLRDLRIPAQQAAKALADCHTAATKMAQFFIPPATFGFLS